MTKKQIKILDTALQLFAHQGYANTATRTIAREAEVSEGLIFRHFTNKEGLLDAIVDQGIADMEAYIEQVGPETEPGEIIAKTIEFPLHMMQRKPDFWKLQMSLKYQHPELARKYDESQLLRDFHLRLEKAFSDLKYAEPAREAELLMLLMGGLFTHMIKHPEADHQNIIDFIQSKYR
jgi:AcrR family transcriptional regulator